MGVWSVSYNGFYATMTILSGHPALKAASPQAPVTEWFLGDDWRHNGAFFLAHAFGFLSSYGRPRTGENEVPGPGFDYGTPDGYDFFLRMGPLGNAEKEFFKGKIDYWQELISHDTYSGYWKACDPLPYLKNVQVAVMTVGGWFDAEDAYGAFHTAQAVENRIPARSTFSSPAPGPTASGVATPARPLATSASNRKPANIFASTLSSPSSSAS